MNPAAPSPSDSSIAQAFRELSTPAQPSGEVVKVRVAAVLRRAVEIDAAPAAAVGGEVVEVLDVTCNCHPETCCCPEAKLIVGGIERMRGTRGLCEDMRLILLSSCSERCNLKADPDGYHYVYRGVGNSEVIRKNDGGIWNGQQPLRSAPYWYSPTAKDTPAAPVGGFVVVGKITGIAQLTGHYEISWTEAADALPNYGVGTVIYTAAQSSVVGAAQTESEFQRMRRLVGDIRRGVEIKCVNDNPQARSSDKDGEEFPECSGTPNDCPENEGYGCCKVAKQPERHPTHNWLEDGDEQP